MKLRLQGHLLVKLKSHLSIALKITEILLMLCRPVRVIAKHVNAARDTSERYMRTKALNITKSSQDGSCTKWMQWIKFFF